MNLELLIENMSEEEQLEYLTKSTNQYMDMIMESELFKIINNKLKSNNKLSEDEWQFILEKIYLIVSKAFLEANNISVADVCCSFFSKIVMLCSRKDSDVYNDSYKMMKLIDICKWEKEINKSLIKGFFEVVDNLDEDKLIILLNQQQDAYNFRYYRDYYLDSINKVNEGSLTTDMYVSINYMDRIYNKQRKLDLNYNNGGGYNGKK